MSPCYHDYYVNQAGTGIGAIYRGSVYQRGHGFGSFLKGLFRSVMPLLRSGLKTVGQEALRSGTHFLDDVASEKPVVGAFKSRVAESAENLKRQVQSKIDSLVGSGCLKRKRKASKSQKRSIRRKVNNDKKNPSRKDIFS